MNLLKFNIQKIIYAMNVKMQVLIIYIALNAHILLLYNAQNALIIFKLERTHCFFNKILKLFKWLL